MHVLIAHGASGRAASMQGHVDGLRSRGVDATAIDLPLRQAERAVPVYRERLDARPEPRSQLIIAGQSYGGRVASLLAAEAAGTCAGLICFSYPLHRPGTPDWEARSAHWTAIDVPVLLLSGTADPFARLELLRRAIDERLPRARLVTFEGVGHSLKPVLGEALDQAAAFALEVAEQNAGAGAPG